MIIIALAALISISWVDAAYNGRGKIYVSHYYKYLESGSRIVYQPENYEKYSAIGEGWTAKMEVHIYASEYYARKSYDQDVLSQRKYWATLKWNSKGKYYYQENYRAELSPGYWVGYGVNIFNRDSELIYEDINNFHQLPSTVEYCELDDNTYISGKKCSDALQSSTTAGATAAGVIISLLIIAIIIGVVICVKRGHCERVKASHPANSTISELFMRNNQRPTAPTSSAQVHQISTSNGVNASPTSSQTTGGHQLHPSNVQAMNVSQNAFLTAAYIHGAQQQVTVVQSTNQAPVNAFHGQNVIAQSPVVPAYSPSCGATPTAPMMDTVPTAPMMDTEPTAPTMDTTPTATTQHSVR